MSDQRQSPARRKLFKIAGDIGLTREERLELASYLLRRDLRSWGDLDESQVMRLLDALEGYELVAALLEMR